MALLSNQYIVFLLIAVTVFVAYITVLNMVKKDTVRERARRVTSADSAAFMPEEARSALALTCEGLLRAFGTDLEKARQEHYLALGRAGLMSSDALAYYLFFRRFMQPLFVVLAGLVALRLASVPQADTAIKLLYLIIIGLLGIIGVAGANLYVSNRTQKRKEILEKSFADALDLLLVCVESGLPLDGALTRVCRELKHARPEITAELDRTRIELNVLNDRTQALQNLADRTDTPGFNTLVASLIQTEKFGTSIAETLRALSEDYRIARMLNAENRAARIPALITVPLIVFILLPFLALIIAPPIIRVDQQGGFFGSPSAAPR